MIRIVIVEDEEAAVERLTEMLAQSTHEPQVIKVLDSVTESIHFFSGTDSYDLILMDIHLSDGNSFEIFRHIEIKKPIIFTTAYSEFALDAFKQYALDYLLKPIKRDQLEIALTKYHQIYQPAVPNYNNLAPDMSSEKSWMIKVGPHIRIVPYADVAYYFTAEKISFLMTLDGKKYPVDLTLEQIETQINDLNFFRINRQYIIHRKAIHSMSTHTKSRVRITLSPTSEEVIVSTERSPMFKKWLKC
jgi:DNA-binding LytR/AlgR family response regulator